MRPNGLVRHNFSMEWKPIATAPFDRELEVAIIDYNGTHALAFPCRRFLHGWINAETKKLLDNLRPTHWREWRLPTRKEPTGKVPN